MNDIQFRILSLQEKGWTLVSIAASVGVTTNAVEKWKYGDRYPINAKAVFLLLDQLVMQKYTPVGVKRREKLK